MAYQYEEESQLTGTTVTEALRHLSIFFTSKSFEEIDETFNFRTDVNKDPEYVLEMITDALKNQFETFDKLRRLMTYFTDKSFEEIENDFSLVTDINVYREYFLEQLAKAVIHHFEATTDSLRDILTLGDLVSFLNSFNLVTDILRQKTALASMK